LVHCKIGSLRGFTNPQSTADSRQKIPPWAQMGSSLADASVGYVSSARKSLISFAHLLTTNIRVQMLKNSLPVYLPIVLGGLGWPHPRGVAYGLERVAPIIMTAIHVIHGFVSDPLQLVKVIARLRASYMCKNAAVDFLWAADLVHTELGELSVSRDEKGAVCSISLEKPLGLPNPELKSRNFFDFISETAAKLSGTRYLTRFEDYVHEDPLILSVSQVAKTFRKELDKILSIRTKQFFDAIDAPVNVETVEKISKVIKNFHILYEDDFLATLTFNYGLTKYDE